MITDFADFCPWMYVLVSDLYTPIAPYFQRLAPNQHVAMLKC